MGSLSIAVTGVKRFPVLKNSAVLRNYENFTRVLPRTDLYFRMGDGARRLWKFAWLFSSHPGKKEKLTCLIRSLVRFKLGGALDG